MRVLMCPSHHGLARPQAAGREDGLEVWIVAANVLSKESGAAERAL